MDSVRDPTAIKRFTEMKRPRPLATNKNFAKDEFKELWKRINHKAAYNEEHPDAPIKGIGKVRAQTLCAAFEFVRRAYDAHDEGFKKKPMADADAAYDLFRRTLPPNTRQEIRSVDGLV